MPQPYRIQVNVDCRDAHAQADWWTETLGWMVEPTTQDFVQAKIERGYATEEDTSCTGACAYGAAQRPSAPSPSSGSRPGVG